MTLWMSDSINETETEQGRIWAPLLITRIGGSPEESEAKVMGGCVCSLVGENENKHVSLHLTIE